MGDKSGKSKRRIGVFMASYGPFEDIEVTVDNYVATVEIQRPPFNYFDYALIQQMLKLSKLSTKN